MLGYFHQRTETNNINYYAPVKKNFLRTFEKEKKYSQIECFKSKSSNTCKLRNLCKTFVDTTKTQSKFERSLDLWAWVIVSISNYDRTLRKTQKSKLFQHLKLSIVSCIAIPENCTQIFDGMVWLQKLLKTLKTFGDISDYILKELLHGSTGVTFL